MKPQAPNMHYQKLSGIFESKIIIKASVKFNNYGEIYDVR